MKKHSISMQTSSNFMGFHWGGHANLIGKSLNLNGNLIKFHGVSLGGHANLMEKSFILLNFMESHWGGH